LKFINNDYSSK